MPLAPAALGMDPGRCRCGGEAGAGRDGGPLHVSRIPGRAGLRDRGALRVDGRAESAAERSPAQAGLSRDSSRTARGVGGGDPSAGEAGVIGVPASIAQAVRAVGGRVTFARFMELALTEPESGYYTRYSRSRPLLGPHGDFTTAPHKVPAFNRAMSRLVAQVVDAMPSGLVLVADVGAGEGDLASRYARRLAGRTTRSSRARRLSHRRSRAVRCAPSRKRHSRRRRRPGGMRRRARTSPIPSRGPLVWHPRAPSWWATSCSTRCLCIGWTCGVIALREAWVRLRESGVVTLEEEWGEVSDEAAAEFECRVRRPRSRAGAPADAGRHGRAAARGPEPARRAG